MKPDFLIIPYDLVANPEAEPADRDVYAVVYWFEHLKDGKCIASNKTIAEIANISTRTVQNSLTKLEKLGYIERVYKDKAKRNRKEIITKISFKRARSGGDSSKTNATVVTNESSGGDRASAVVVTRESNSISNRIKNSKKTFLHGNQWNILIDLFEPVNPMFEEFYKRKTERAALDHLAQKIGFDKLKATLEHLPKITALPYAPKITKPTELKRDLGKLITFYKQENGKIKSKGRKILV